MWIVLFALRYKYTVAVMAIGIALFGVLSARNMSTDIMPRVESPELLQVWTYGGLNAREMAAKIVSFAEIATLNNVDDLIEVRSETLNGIGLVKLKFQPFADPERALAQVTSVSQTILRRMPAGTQPPLIVRTSPSNVPILQLVISSDRLTNAELFDWARLSLRAQIQSIPGIRLTLPYGGAGRQIMVDLDPVAINAAGLSAADVGRALGAQNLTLPSGNIREGERDMPVSVNASPVAVEEFLDLPVKTVGGSAVLLRDVAHVRDGEALSSNIARLNGENAVIVSILKLGSASTLDIIRGILDRLPSVRASAPPGLHIEPIFDQSVFVRAAINTVIKEIFLVGALVSLMVLLFLGSWRSTAIVLTSIPLALLSSVIGLNLAGATFNLMSLGGLALAIGILVDNALVEIENIKRQIGLGKGVRQAILDGAQQVAFPEFVSTTSICIVFLPVFLLTGTASDVFKPLALAVIFAMIASYILSRTLVPTLASLLLPAEIAAEKHNAGRPPRGLLRIHAAIENAIHRGAAAQRRALGVLLLRRWIIPSIVLAVVALGVLAGRNLGREFFPATDAGLIRLFVRLPAGLRVEETARRFAEIQHAIRATIPPDELLFVVENIGLPSAVNLAWIESTAATTSDGEILIQLRPGLTAVERTTSALRAMLARDFPDARFFFRAADATSQTLSGGAPTAFEVGFIGRDVNGNLALAEDLIAGLRATPGAVDVTLREVLDRPEYFLEIDRVRASKLGVTQQDAVSAVLAALGSGGSVSPSFWADPVAGVSYEVQLQVPAASLTDVDQLMGLPVTPSNGSRPVLLGAFATITERRAPAMVSRATLLPKVTVLANVEGTDIGSVLDRLEPILAEMRGRQKPGNRIELSGQARLMNSAYRELFAGLALSAALMGLIMVVGVSTANSILVTSFARDLLADGLDAANAAVDAAVTRLRPVLMTALTMILGVFPMALGFGEGGEQNAPLGRAVIGGLMLGTLASLFVVPLMFAWAKKRTRPAAPGDPQQQPAEATA